MNAYEVYLWILIVALLGIIFWQRFGQRIKSDREKQKHKPKKRRPFRLRPKEPKDCPDCVAGVTLRQVNPAPPELVPPHTQTKKPGGPKKRIRTQGYACPFVDCKYHGNRDQTVHALVGAGKRGVNGEIQWFKCQACHTRFSSRRDTPLQDLKSAPTHIELILNFLAEGVDPSTIMHVCGHSEETLVRWMDRAGQHAGLLHDAVFHDLDIPYLEMDEIRINIRQEEGKSWLWANIDPATKIVPSIHIGRRTNNDAQIFIHDTKLRLAPNCIPLVTTDGLRQYFWALTSHFGHWVKRFPWRKHRWLTDPRLLYAQIIKKKKRYKLKDIITRVQCGTKKAVREKLKSLGFSGIVGTSHIERMNLTFRHLVSALARKTWSLAQKKEKLRNQVEWSRAYYHFVRIHSSLTLGPEVPREQRYCTPAMAAGLTDHRWTTLEILHLPLKAADGDGTVAVG